MVSLFGQTVTWSRGEHRFRGAVGIRRRDGQHPDTRQVVPAGAAQLRAGPAVLVRGRLAAGRLRGAGGRVHVHDGRVCGPVAVAAGIAVLPDDGRSAGRRGQVLVAAEELHGRRAPGRAGGRREIPDEH